MTRFLKYSGIIILILILILLALPYLISLDKYKGDIIAEIKEETGRELSIKDTITFSILPSPKIILSNIELSGLPDEKEIPIVKVDKAKVVLSIFPLFTGNIVISDILLDHPDFYFEKTNKTINKNELKNANNDKLDNGSGNGGDIVPFQVPKLPFSIKSLVIENGRITYLQDNEKVVFENINLAVKNLLGQGAMEIVLNSKFLSEDVIINGSINANQAIMPVNAECKIKGEKITISGNFNASNLNFTGEMRLQGNTEHLAKFIPSIPQDLKQEYTLNTVINVNKEALLLSDLKFSMGKILAKGEGKYNFKDQLPTLNMNIMPGNIVLDINNKLSSDVWGINIKSQDLPLLLKSLDINTKDLPPFLNHDISLKALATHGKSNVNIKNISLLLGEANLTGNIEIDWQSKLNISYNIETNKGAALINSLGIPFQGGITEIKIKGESSEQNKIWQTDTRIILAETDAHIVGNIDTNKGYKTNLAVTGSGKNLGNSLKKLLNMPQPLKDFGAFSLSNTIVGEMPRFDIVINKCEINVNGIKTSLVGKANIDLLVKPKINLTLSTSEINLNSLPNRDQQQYTKNHEANNNRSSEPKWSKEKIDLAFLTAFDGTFNITVPKFTKGPLNIDTIKSKLQIINGKLELEQLSGRIYGGTMDASGYVLAKNGEMLLNLQLKQARLKDLVPDYKKIKITDGTFNLNSKLQSTGTSADQYINNLSGNIQLIGTEGKLSGINLQKILEVLNNLKDFSSVMNLLDTSFSGGQTAFSSLETNIFIKQGIATFNDFKLEAPSIALKGEGEVNLPKYYADVKANIKADVKNLPPFGVRFYGSLDNLQHNVEDKALKKYLLENVLTKAIDKIQGDKGGAGKIIKNLIGGGKSDEPSSNNDNSPEDQNNKSDDDDPLTKATEKLLKKGLGNIFSN